MLIRICVANEFYGKGKETNKDAQDRNAGVCTSVSQRLNFKRRAARSRDAARPLGEKRQSRPQKEIRCSSADLYDWTIMQSTK
jgi:hypothetical protein